MIQKRMSGFRRFITTTFLPILAAGSAFADNPPHIIFILADDQGWNGLSVRMDPDVAHSKSDYYQTVDRTGSLHKKLRPSN